MDLGFGGEVVDFYQRYRRGYPGPVIDALVAAFALTDDHLVVDLGCGTGQLALPLAERVRAVVGIDPEPDMLVAARGAAERRGQANIGWMIGAAADISTLISLLGAGSVGAVTIGQALHWMDHDALFTAARPLLAEGAGIAVVTNGTPLWQQDAAFSHALNEVLEQWLRSPSTATCGTDEDSQQLYRQSLTAAGYTVSSTEIRYLDELNLEQIIGNVYSAMSVDRMPLPAQRAGFTARIAEALEPHAPFIEEVRVQLLYGHAR